LSSAYGCDSVIITTLTVNSLPVVNLGPDTIVCEGLSYTLDALNPGSTFLWSTGATTSAITVDTALLNPGANTVIVKVTSADGCEAIDSVVVTFSVCTAVPSTMLTSMNIYPNPTRGIATIDFGSTQKSVTISVISVTGQLISEELQNNIRSYTMDLEHLPKGLYLIKMTTTSEILMGRVVVE
jgi:hypothetical protein